MSGIWYSIFVNCFLFKNCIKFYQKNKKLKKNLINITNFAQHFSTESRELIISFCSPNYVWDDDIKNALFFLTPAIISLLTTISWFLQYWIVCFSSSDTQHQPHHYRKYNNRPVRLQMGQSAKQLLNYYLV